MMNRHRVEKATFKRSAFAAVVAALAVIGCASPPKARVDQDTKANFSAYRTFGWLEQKSAEAGDPTVEIATLKNQRVRSALAAGFQSKGLMLIETTPDVKINYVLNVHERPKQSGMRIGLGAGGGSGNVGGGVGVSVPVGKRSESVAAMTVDVIDVARNAQVWTGSYDTVIKGQEASDADVKKLVDTILSKYPAR